jgi:hypothetical protein
MLALLPTDGSDPLLLRIDHDEPSPTTRQGDEK